MNNVNASGLAELKERETGVIEELLQLKIRKSVGQLKQSHLIRVKRKEIARIKTSMRMVDRLVGGDSLVKTKKAGK